MKLIKSIVQRLLPQHFISWCCGVFVSRPWPWLKNWQIKTFIKKYDVNLAEFEKDQVEDYRTFNEFFIRKPKYLCQPISPSPAQILSPAEGLLLQRQAINNDTVILNKGKNYHLTTLVGNGLSKVLQQPFLHNIYLSPTDYHRVHMPCDGKISAMQYFPGRLFSVNPQHVANIPYIYTRNERLVCKIQGDGYKLILVIVGALLVNGIVTNWAGKINQCLPSGLIQLDQPACFEQGEEIAHFQFGSTVMLLHDQIDFSLITHSEQQQLAILSPLATRK